MKQKTEIGKKVRAGADVCQLVRRRTSGGRRVPESAIGYNPVQISAAEGRWKQQ